MKKGEVPIIEEYYVYIHTNGEDVKYFSKEFRFNANNWVDSCRMSLDDAKIILESYNSPNKETRVCIGRTLTQVDPQFVILVKDRKY